MRKFEKFRASLCRECPSSYIFAGFFGHRAYALTRRLRHRYSSVEYPDDRRVLRLSMEEIESKLSTRPIDLPTKKNYRPRERAGNTDRKNFGREPSNARIKQLLRCETYPRYRVPLINTPAEIRYSMESSFVSSKERR